ncbi:hypothetical protein ACIQF6_34095 [Kitasatospora sp. NPDC092948]|uniref:hypothetical protein n=1 Tax=Kitasatospora sp. NPDC092948 TaxID=3364088 RepID=UPI00380562C3
MKISYLFLRATACALGTLLLAGCGTRTPASQEARLTKASGVASISVVMPEGLWKDTKPWRDLDKVPVDHLDGDRGARGLIRVNLTGTQVVTYMKYLDGNAHPGPGGGLPNKQPSARVYDAIGSALDTIKPARTAGDPAPEVLIDDTLATTAP